MSMYIWLVVSTFQNKLTSKPPNTETKKTRKMGEQHQGLRKEQSLPAVLACTQRTNNDVDVRYSEGAKVFDRVREKLYNFNEYCQFLKLVYMYSMGRIKGDELEIRLAALLPADTDLLNDFIEFKRLCCHATVQGKELRGRTSPGAESKRAKTTIIDSYKPERCTPSYRPQLASEFQAHNIVASTSKEAAPILNGGAKFSNKTNNKTNNKITSEDEYEDKRYELDMALESLNSTIDNARKLQNCVIKKVGNESKDSDIPIRLEDYFSASNIKVLCAECYGFRIKQKLSRRAVVVLPGVLDRLNQRREEVLKEIHAMRVG